MKILKSILGFGLMLLALNGMAQERHKSDMSKDPAERAKMQTEKMTEHLGLSDEQQRKVLIINTKYADDAYLIRKEYQKDQEAMKQKMKMLRKEQDTAIKAVLNEKQIAMWEEHKQERKQNMQQKKKMKEEAPSSK